VQVPRLSLLKSAVGECTLNAFERIGVMIAKGELPSGDVCLYSGRLANETMFFHVQCERPHVRGADNWSIGKTVVFVVSMVLLFGWIVVAIAWALRSRSHPREELGRDISLALPLRINSDVHDEVARMNSWQLKKLLSRVPIYEELFREYPRAVVAPLSSRETKAIA
jgi:hypothetical protein